MPDSTASCPRRSIPSAISFRVNVAMFYSGGLEKYMQERSLPTMSRLECPKLLIHLQHRQERFLRNLDAADFFHPLLAFFLFLEQLALTRDITAVAFRDHVLANRFHSFARDYFRADVRLDW